MPRVLVLAGFGDTKVICTASHRKLGAAILRGKGRDWITAEYGMLPRSTNSRMQRKARQRQAAGAPEISRLIGRSPRAAGIWRALETPSPSTAM